MTLPMKTLLITANLGSLFEDFEQLVPIWIKEVASKIHQLSPVFIAFHFQEVGGKTYQRGISLVGNFLKILLSNQVFSDFDRKAVLWDWKTQPNTFTALGGCFLIHKSCSFVERFDFDDEKFYPLECSEFKNEFDSSFGKSQ
eukprot:Sdes_comp10878_c0_seq1m2537